jgi:hypothetical protein
MIDFSQQIANFTNYGTYDYIFDDVGNEILNPSSSTFQQVYFALPLGNCVYNESKILSFYDPNFTEFVPITASVTGSIFSQEVLDTIASYQLRNSQLQDQLSALVASSEQSSGSASQQAVKNTIVNLRIQLGQGSSLSDFEDVYPYSPISLEMKPAPTSSI